MSASSSTQRRSGRSSRSGSALRDVSRDDLHGGLQGTTHNGAILTVDLGAIAENYRSLESKLSSGAVLGAVVKADAYGLGVAQVAPALSKAGCRHFFVADLVEGDELRRILPNDELIYVFNGPLSGASPAFVERRLIPVLNEPGQIREWSAYARNCEKKGGSIPPCALHVDTGMARLGLALGDVAALTRDGDLMAGLNLTYVLSHLACADEPENPMNARQLADFKKARELLKGIKGSLANSSGIFLGTHYQSDLVRAGGALYGMNPRPDTTDTAEKTPPKETTNPMAPSVTLEGKILQIRDVDSPMSVGYGATYCVPGKGRIATVGVGYADGYLRSLSNRGSAFIGDIRVPLVGRVSMDYITLDVSKIPSDALKTGDLVELIGRHHGVDALAREAGTLGYEILTSLSPRYGRVYLESA